MRRDVFACGAAAFIALVMCASPAAASQNLIHNGDFSTPFVGLGTYDLVPMGYSFDSWHVVGVNGDVAIMSGTFVQAGYTFDADRSQQWLDLTGISDTATGVTQSVSSVIGDRYTLRFSTGNVYEPGGILGVSSTMEVLVDGAKVMSATNSRGRGTTRQIWKDFKYSFVATSSTTTVTFINGDPSNDTEDGLDDVVLTQDGSGIAPSSIATSIPTPREALLPLSSLAVNGGIAAAVALLLTFPSQLFNQTLQENYADLALWWRRKLRWLPIRKRQSATTEPLVSTAPHVEGRIDRDLSYLEKRWVFVLVFVGGVLANAFNDGSLGLTASSFVTVIAVALALAIGVAIPALVTGIYHTMRHGGSPRKLMALPAGLALAVVMVLFSRLINFEPGYLYGFVCGVLFTRELASNEKGHVAALSVCTTLVLSALAWVAWVPVNAAALRPGAFFGVVLADDVLGALFVSGLVGSFFGMLPIRGLPGWTVKRWNTWAWVFAFGLSVLGLFQILLRPGIAGHGHRPLITSVVLFVLFGAGSVSFHEYFERKHERAARPSTVPVDARTNEGAQSS